MLTLYFSLGIITFIAISQRVLGQKQAIHIYAFWFLVVLGSIYAAKGCCEHSLRDFFYNDEFYLYLEEDNPFEYILEDYQSKFVPPGTPSKYINEDGMLY